MSTSHARSDIPALATLTLAALGVVYGDIGTSPLYALKEVFHAGHVPVSPENILGVLSLIFWTLTVIVSFKYVLLILRADNNGEGGLIAMLALATSAVKDRPSLQRVLMMVGAFGTAVFYGDGVITPAISVLSAVEGLEIAEPRLHAFIVPVTLFVLTLLFAVQRFGTGGVGRLFGPVMLVWFVVLAVLGLDHVFRNPTVLVAINPLHAYRFVAAQPLIAFIALGAVVLCVTGGEALYADMGHFGRMPIRIAWYGFAMPALVCNYFGQGALLLADQSAVENPFYLMAPDWAQLPLVCLATAATVIASQALISAAFSVTRQAIQLGILPRMAIHHTSAREAGQIYVPFINWNLYLLIVLVVGLFKSSANLAAAYGIAVTLDMSITTILTFFVLRYGWRYPVAIVLPCTAFFLGIDITFFLSNLLKVAAGGWFPLLIGSGMFLLMDTWQRGRVLVRESVSDMAIDLASFIESIFLSPPLQVPGTAIYLSPQPGLAPSALMHNLKHYKVLHEYNLFIDVKMHEVPWIRAEERCTAQSLGHNCWQVTLHYGFMDDPDVPAALKQFEERGVPLGAMETSYFLSRDIVLATSRKGMALWRERLFASMHRNASDIGRYLHLPSNRVVELGANVEI